MNNSKKLEELIDSCGNDDINRSDIKFGWNGCKREILEILSRPLQNYGLNYTECDKRYIQEIEKL